MVCFTGFNKAQEFRLWATWWVFLHSDVLFWERLRLKREERTSLWGKMTNAQYYNRQDLEGSPMHWWCDLQSPVKGLLPQAVAMGRNKHIIVIRVCAAAAAAAGVSGKGLNHQSALIWQYQGNTIFSNFGQMGWVLLSMSTSLVGFSLPLLATLMVGPASFLAPELSMLPRCALAWSDQQIFTTSCKGGRRKGLEVESKP